MVSIHDSRHQGLLQRLLAARLEAELTQAEVARALGHPQSLVSKSETGERRVDVVELADFATLYKRPLTFFAPFASA